MNQNRNGVNGEASDAFVETIRQTAPGSTDLLSITGIPAVTVTAGTSETFTVTALSPNGGTDTSFVGTIEFTSTDSQAVLPASYTFTAADDGTYTFTVTFKTAGTQSITATDTANAAIIGTEDNIIVQAAAAQSLKVDRLPDDRHRRHAGDVHRHRLRRLRQRGHRLRRHGAVHQQRQPGDPPGQCTPSRPEEQGTFTFTATLKTAGTQSITATDTATSSITGTESNIVVQAAAARTLALTGFPTTDTGRGAGSVHGHRLRRLRQRGDRLHRHGGLHQQRPQGRPAG